MAATQRMDAPQGTIVQLTATDGSGDWIPSDQLWSSACALLLEGVDVSVPLESVKHLDASALQILLALGAGRGRKSHTLKLASPATGLERWFHFAGATALLERSSEEPGSDTRGCAEDSR